MSHGESADDEDCLEVDLRKLPGYLLIVGRKDRRRALQAAWNSVVVAQP